MPHLLLRLLPFAAVAGVVLVPLGLEGSPAAPGAAPDPVRWAGLPGDGPRAPGAVGDTVVPVERSERLVVQNLRGRLLVGGDEGAELRLLSGRGGGVGAELRVVRRGTSVVVEGSAREGRSRRGDVELRIPRWLPVEVRGTELDVEVRGIEAPVEVETVDGDVTVREVTGSVRAGSVEGRVRVEEVEGAVEARSVDEEVRLRAIRGEVRAHSTDGDLLLDGVEGPRVEARTVDGDVRYRGTVRSGATVTLVTHDGDVEAAVPRGTGARVSVSTWDGEFEAAFPVTLERFSGGREMTFTLGGGGGELILQAFDGDILLRWTEGA